MACPENGSEYERGRQQGLREAIAYHQRGETDAYNSLWAAQERYSEAAGDAAQERINWHSTAADHFGEAIKNPEYFGLNGGVQ